MSSIEETLPSTAGPQDRWVNSIQWISSPKSKKKTITKICERRPFLKKAFSIECFCVFMNIYCYDLYNLVWKSFQFRASKLYFIFFKFVFFKLSSCCCLQTPTKQKATRMNTTKNWIQLLSLNNLNKYKLLSKINTFNR